LIQKNKFFRFFILSIIGVALAFTFFGLYNKDGGTVEIGKPAPDFVLKTLDGQEITLSHLQGKGIVLNFWATWCDPCRREMPLIEEKYQQLKDKGVEVLAINIAESEVSVSGFVNRLGITFPILMDKDRQITNLYEVGPLPSTFFIDKNGTVVAHFVGEMNDKTINDHLAMIIP
jgi:peroxiredoxin